MSSRVTRVIPPLAEKYFTPETVENRRWMREESDRVMRED